jgi:23S rRNA pseudouridine1911/1915/1917 synthase
MSHTLHFVADRAGERVDTFLARIAPQYSRSYWQKLCELGEVRLDSHAVKANHRLQPHNKITAILPATPSFLAQQLPVVYEDDDVIVINKPAGILTHAKGAISEEFSVAEFIRPRTTDGPETNRPGIVHRLDRHTSGLIIAAKNPEAKRWLQGQFTKRKVKKTYIALVEGHLKEPEALLRLPIERNPKKPQSFRVGPSGKQAETQYRVEATYSHHDLLSLQPFTGRTHQLRVHLHYLGHPIVGDQLYGKPDKQLPRLFLHASRLELTLPTRVRKVFTAPLPAELQNYLKTLK